jgi:hypothetical protein
VVNKQVNNQCKMEKTAEAELKKSSGEDVPDIKCKKL